MTQKELEKRKWCIVDDIVEEIKKIYPEKDYAVRVDLKDQFYKSGILLFEWNTFETELDALETLRDNTMEYLNDINKRIADIKGVE